MEFNIFSLLEPLLFWSGGHLPKSSRHLHTAAGFNAGAAESTGLGLGGGGYHGNAYGGGYNAGSGDRERRDKGKRREDDDAEVARVCAAGRALRAGCLPHI
jgi:hypothetical protein